MMKRSLVTKSLLFLQITLSLQMAQARICEEISGYIVDREVSEEDQCSEIIKIFQKSKKNSCKSLSKKPLYKWSKSGLDCATFNSIKYDMLIVAEMGMGAIFGVDLKSKKKETFKIPEQYGFKVYKDHIDYSHYVEDSPKYKNKKTCKKDLEEEAKKRTGFLKVSLSKDCNCIKNIEFGGLTQLILKKRYAYKTKKTSFLPSYKCSFNQ